MTTERSIVLAGPPGSGKSAVGRALARLLGRELVDMDSEIEARLGMTVAEIFRKRGEHAFREAETALCLELAGRAGLVVAAGGGALVRPENRRALGACIVVGLTATRDELVRRTAGDGRRPLLGDEPHERAARLDGLLGDRRGAYGSVPLEIDTTGRGVDEVARLVAEAVGP
jgi:shikimate kinase